jgi:peptidoglycan hydrolase-like protein with peptidoglycan-binding domain
MGSVGKPGRTRVRRVAVAVAAVAAVAAAVAAANGIGLAGMFGGDKSDGADAAGLPPATAHITRQTLVDAKTVSGDLGYGATIAVSGRLAGTVTALPATGSTVGRGQVLYRVNNDPVVLLFGGIPAYRALSSGMKGPDVKQLEANLEALGYDGFTVDDDYTSSTAAAVRQWQTDLGLAKTGTVELGRVIYAPTAVRVDTTKAALGDQVGPGMPVLTYTGSTQVITVELAYTEKRLAKKDAAVSVKLPDGKTVSGKVSASTMVIKPSATAEDKDTTVFEVTVTVDDPKNLTGLDQAALDVAFTASERKDVLTVPVAALLALSEGGYGVELVEGERTRIVPVKTGLFSGGRVEVTGDGITEGATVGMPT